MAIVTTKDGTQIYCLSAELIKRATLKVYPGLPHGLCSTHKDQINADLLAVIKA